MGRRRDWAEWHNDRGFVQPSCDHTKGATETWSEQQAKSPGSLDEQNRYNWGDK